MFVLRCRPDLCKDTIESERPDLIAAMLADIIRDAERYDDKAELSAPIARLYSRGSYYNGADMVFLTAQEIIHDVLDVEEDLAREDGADRVLIDCPGLYTVCWEN